jgi:hypothetical protein
VRAFLTLAALSALLALAAAGCGGGSSDDGSAQSKQESPPAQNDQAGAEPAPHTPESCLGDAGVDAMQTPTPRIWRGEVHKAGYSITIKRFNSPAAAHRAVQAAAVARAAEQSNFFGVFGPPLAQDDGSTAKVARCLSTL